jgi:membrane-bound lytic murein transglycosylase B
VITRYNWSAFYALAVIELGEAVQRARQRALTGGPSTMQLASTSPSSPLPTAGASQESLR